MRWSREVSALRLFLSPFGLASLAFGVVFVLCCLHLAFPRGLSVGRVSCYFYYYELRFTIPFLLGVDPLLARHVAHLWVRDPLVIYGKCLFGFSAPLALKETSLCLERA
mgnify:CR=1 FL=1